MKILGFFFIFLFFVCGPATAQNETEAPEIKVEKFEKMQILKDLDTQNKKWIAVIKKDFEFKDSITGQWSENRVIIDQQAIEELKNSLILFKIPRKKEIDYTPDSRIVNNRLDCKITIFQKNQQLPFEYIYQFSSKDLLSNNIEDKKYLRVQSYYEGGLGDLKNIRGRYFYYDTKTLNDFLSKSIPAKQIYRKMYFEGLAALEDSLRKCDKLLHKISKDYKGTLNYDFSKQPKDQSTLNIIEELIYKKVEKVYGNRKVISVSFPYSTDDSTDLNTYYLHIKWTLQFKDPAIFKQIELPDGIKLLNDPKLRPTQFRFTYLVW